MRAIDVRHMGNEKVICCWEFDGVLVDPGPQSTEETLLAALGDGFEPKAVLLTHIHFDVAGVRIPPAAYVVAPTPPPDIDVEAWERSIDVVAGWRPATLALTHFGRVDDVGRHLAAMRERLHEIVGLAAQHGMEAFAAGILDRIERNAGDVAAAYLQAAPPDHLYLGARRYLDKRAAA